MKAPVLTWKRDDEDGSWSAKAGVIELYVAEPDESWPYIWTLGTFQNPFPKEGEAKTLEEAQVAAEEAAFQVLREGILALEGLAVARGKAALVMDALWEYGCSPEGGYPHFDKMRALANELGGDLKTTVID